MDMVKITTSLSTVQNHSMPSRDSLRDTFDFEALMIGKIAEIK